MNKNRLFVTTSILLLLSTSPIDGDFGKTALTDAPFVAGEMADDNTIALNIQNSISSDRDLAKFLPLIIIQSDKGTVILSGFVDDEKAKLALAEKAKETIGVTNVVNKLEVNPTISNLVNK
jgi:osmotically-inducible protein OsmY